MNSTKPTLYPFQEKAVAELVEGRRICTMPVGSGKTSVMMTWLKQTGKKKVLIITTPSKRDSCFPSGTMVKTRNGEKPIEDVKVGEEVLSYLNGKVIPCKVLRSISMPTQKALIRMTFGGCCDIIGTEDHPIYVGNGQYKPLGEIEPGDTIYGITGTTSRSKQEARAKSKKGICNSPEHGLRLLREEDNRANESAEGPTILKRDNLLFTRMLEEGTIASDKASKREGFSKTISGRCKVQPMRQDYKRNYANYASNLEKEQKNILFFRMCEIRKSKAVKRNVQKRNEEVGGIDCYKESPNYGGEGHTYKSASERVSLHNRRNNGACGILRGYLRSDRCGLPGTEISSRDKRETTRIYEHKETRCGEGHGIRAIRVESVEILRPRNSGEHTVYCITVDRAHNFFANNILVHNCDMQKEADMWNGTEWRAGLDEFTVISWAGLAKFVNRLKKYDELAEYAVAADEVQAAKHGVQSQRGKAFLKIARYTDTWTGYTATPGDKWIDFQAYAIATGLTKNLTSFRRDYCVVQTFKGYPEIIGYNNEHHLKKWWNKVSCRPDTSEMYKEMPEQVNQMVRLPKPRTYDKVMKTRETPEGDFLESTMALCHYARQACAVDKARVQWLQDYMESNPESTVFFTNYKYEAEMVAQLHHKIYPHAKCWRIDGQHHEIPTPDTIGKNDIVVANYQSGSEGLNLQFMHYCVFVSPNYSYSTSSQAKGRINRIGQKQVMYYYALCAEDTIEEDIYKTLSTKQDFSEETWCARLEKK